MNRSAPAFVAPAVIVRGGRDVATVLAAGWRVTLLSAAGAAAFAGPLWWAALVRHARAQAPTLVASDILDVADAPATALAAFRCGCATVALDPACPAWHAVASVAREIGAVLLDAVPAALDLAEPGAARRLGAWLGDDSRGDVG